MLEGKVADLHPLPPAEGILAEEPESPHRFRTLFISDVHLGTWGCKAENLVDFLRHHTADTIYLVGDIVDGWRLRSKWHWPQSHNDLVQKLLRLARKGRRIIYIPGNHDEVFRSYLGLSFGGITLRGHAVHRTADGRNLLVLHGDEFDAVVLYSKWIARLGAVLYDLLVLANHGFNFVRRKLGFGYWSLSAFVKHKVKNIVSLVSRFEEALLREVRRRGADGVVCGHIHKADLRMAGDLLYANTGDWIESCTALAERYDGSLELIAWTEVRGPAAKPASAA
ncbi:MAG: UDP-2,3-diacylglucosamine diphosphatase [Holophaga sp.]|jgi:UDP-2,3-diacylglucosamine pyrophosphatase LpxH